MDPGTLLVTEQVVSTTIEGAALAAIGLAQSTQPLSVKFTRFTSESFLPRSSHTLTVVGGRAYIFGGKNEKGELAGDEMHIVTLPLKTRTDGESDYICVPALGIEGDGQVPEARSGHGACAIGDCIYVFGGQGAGSGALDENGRIWLFDTNSLHWSHLDPKPHDEYPRPRFQAGCVATEHPLHLGPEGELKKQTQETINKAVPTIIQKPLPPAVPYGTLFITSGLSSSGSEPLPDAWAFSVASQKWSKLPSIPSLNLSSPPPLTLAQGCLYLVAGSSEIESKIHYLSLPKILRLQSDPEEQDESETPSSWQTISFPTNPIVPGPRPRKGAGFLPITTGNGRSYILYFLGERASADRVPAASVPQGAEHPTFWSDAFSYQPPASFPSPANVKDSTRSKLGISNGEGTWAEVMVLANEEGDGKSHPGPRGWFGSDVISGAEVVLWGGVNGKETDGDGWIVNIK